MEPTRGPLLLIGGAEDKVGAKAILAHFIQLAGGEMARIAIIPTASSFQELVAQRYMSLFTALGAAQVDMLRIFSRPEASDPAALEQLDEATGIFITGGDQLKLTALLGGTPVGARLVQRSRAGCVVAGTSAGASAAPQHMLAYGASGVPPRKSMMQFAPGLGLIGGVVIDQHFGARNRAGRLITAVAHNPSVLGIGLDEDTAVEIDSSGMLTALGQGAIMVVDGSEISYTDIHRVPEHAPIALFNLRIHMLSSGYHYDLATRSPALPTVAPVHVEPGLMYGEGI